MRASKPCAAPASPTATAWSGPPPSAGVCPEYGEMRNEAPSEGRWINSLDELERRRVVFLGARVREQLFSGRHRRRRNRRHWRRPLHRHRHHGPQDPAQQLFLQRRRLRLDPLLRRWRSLEHTTRRRPDLRAHRPAIRTTRHGPGAGRRRRRVSNFLRPTRKPFRCSAAKSFVPSSMASPSACRSCLTFIGILTLGIGGVGVMNIMLVSVDETNPGNRLAPRVRRAQSGTSRLNSSPKLCSSCCWVEPSESSSPTWSPLPSAPTADGAALRRRLRQSRHPSENFTGRPS